MSDKIFTLMKRLEKLAEHRHVCPYLYKLFSATKHNCSKHFIEENSVITICPSQGHLCMVLGKEGRILVDIT
jgi:hypothetical protein